MRRGRRVEYGNQSRADGVALSDDTAMESLSCLTRASIHPGRLNRPNQIQSTISSAASSWRSSSAIGLCRGAAATSSAQRVTTIPSPSWHLPPTRPRLILWFRLRLIQLSHLLLTRLSRLRPIRLSHLQPTLLSHLQLTRLRPHPTPDLTGGPSAHPHTCIDGGRPLTVAILLSDLLYLPAVNLPRFFAKACPC